MPQVLEAPEVHDDARSSIAVADDQFPISTPAGWTSPAQPERRTTHWLRAVISIFTRSKPERNPEYAATAQPTEAALDRLYRTDPYIAIRSLSG